MATGRSLSDDIEVMKMNPSCGGGKKNQGKENHAMTVSLRRRKIIPTLSSTYHHCFFFGSAKHNSHRPLKVEALINVPVLIRPLAPFRKKQCSGLYLEISQTDTWFNTSLGD